MNADMKAHGVFHIVSSGSIIYIKALGEWNEVAYKQLRKQYITIQEKVNKPYIEIIDMTDWALGTMTMLDRGTNRHQYAIESGRELLIVIKGDDDLKYEITKEHVFKHVLSKEDYISFSTLEETFEYLKGKGKEISKLVSYIENFQYPNKSTCTFIP